MSGRERVFLSVAGQALWAISQAAIVIILSRQSELALVGLFTVGLGIFAPLCLAGSLNLRVAVSIDRNGTVPAALALGLRGAVAAVNVLITAIILWPLSTDKTLWCTATVLIATRVADQISDVAIGFYQRDNRQSAIARSFAIRGAVFVVPFLAVILAGGSVLTAALMSLIASLIVVAIVDVFPLIQRDAMEPRESKIDLRSLVAQYYWMGPYPLLDNLHFNSFRFAMFFDTSEEFMGLIGVAQTLYAPFQLIATALGFEYLPEARRIAERNDPVAMSGHILRGVKYGVGVAAGYLLCALMVPAWALELIFGARGAAVTSVAILVGFAVLPMLAAGFVALSLAARDLQRAYMIGPVVGLVSLSLILGGTKLLIGAPTAYAISFAFFVSALLRLFSAFASAMWLPTHCRQLSCIK